MAVYDIGADASTAVTACLAQFTISANGDIRYSAGADTFHTWWLHRSLQKIAWDLSISGDDGINLTKPNPSTSEALGTIITLLDHTTAYGVNYNVTSTEMEYFFGGSIVQDGGLNRWSGLVVVGSVASPTELQIIYNNALVTSHWGTGKNQTDSATLLRIMIQTITGGVEIDGSRVTVKANEWGDTYSVFRSTLGLGEKVAAINTSSDPQNTTAIGTVAGYTGIVNTEGYQLVDVGTGGPKPYLANWTFGSNDKKALYEYTKWQMVRGTAETVYGMDANLFLGGPTFKADVTGAGAELLVQNEVLSWTEGGTASTGVLMGADDLTDGSTTEVWIHLTTGINPTSSTVLTGAAGEVTLSADATSLIPSFNHLGQFTGSAWIGHYGIGFAPAETTKDDALNPLDNSGPIVPPNNVIASVTVNGAPNSRVMLGIKDEVTGGVDQTQYTTAAGNTSGNSTFVINEAIAVDTPANGSVLILEGTTFEFIEYTSWSGSTFTLSGTLPQTYTASNDVIVPILYEEIAADGGTASTSLVQSTNINVVGWVRHGDPASPDKPVPISGTIGSAGLALTVQLDDE